MVTILIGTETGTAEFVGDDISALLDEHDIANTTHLSPEPDDIVQSQTIIICTSTHGAGELPHNLQPIFAWLEGTKPDLSKIKFLTIGLGDSSYDTFCQAAKIAQDQLTALGANPICELFTVDAMSDELPEDLIIPWLSQKLHLF